MDRVKERPTDIPQPGPGQESVWDYPRPPRVEETSRHIQVIFNGVTLADTHRALRVLETSGAPVYYIPPEDVRWEYLEPARQTTYCEWKGDARYYTIRVNGKTARAAAWYYPDPLPHCAGIRDHIAFYPQKMDACVVDGEVAHPQPGQFYGGWITHDVLGPFKGAPGSENW